MKSYFALLRVFPAVPKVSTAEMKMCVWVFVCVADRAISHTLFFPTPRARVYVRVAFVSVCVCVCSRDVGKSDDRCFSKTAVSPTSEAHLFSQTGGFFPVPIHTCPVSFCHSQQISV